MPNWSRVNIPELPEFPAFAHATVAGDHIYVAGMLGLSDDFAGMVDGGIAAETTQALASSSASCALDRGGHSPRSSSRSVRGRVIGSCDARELFGAKVEFDCAAYRPAVKPPPAADPRQP